MGKVTPHEHADAAPTEWRVASRGDRLRGPACKYRQTSDGLLGKCDVGLGGDVHRGVQDF